MQLINVKAPFSPEQVQRLNEYQCGFVIGRHHPFTCLHREHGLSEGSDIGSAARKVTHEVIAGHRGLLVATPTGWVCPHCGYVTDWAFSFMCDRPALPQAPDRDKLKQLIATYTILTTKKAPGAAFMLASLESLRDQIEAPVPTSLRHQTKRTHHACP